MTVFGRLVFTMLFCADVSAASLAARCDSCSDYSKQQAAFSAVQPASGLIDVEVYVIDNAARDVQKYEVSIENEPGYSYSRALRVPPEAGIAEFAESYWAASDSLKTIGIEVPRETSPTIIDFLGNSRIEGNVRFHIENQLSSLLSFPANLTFVAAQFLAGRIPALGEADGLLVELHFADGGQLRVRLKLGVDISTGEVAIVEMETIDGSGWLMGESIPTSPEGFERYDYTEHGPNDLISQLERLAMMYGIALQCQVSMTSSARLVCDASGNNCVTEVTGSCQ